MSFPDKQIIERHIMNVTFYYIIVYDDVKELFSDTLQLYLNNVQKNKTDSFKRHAQNAISIGDG